MIFCPFCRTPVDPDDETAYIEIAAWVHGPKKDGATLRSETGYKAHEECIKKAQAGQPNDQESLFE